MNSIWRRYASLSAQGLLRRRRLSNHDVISGIGEFGKPLHTFVFYTRTDFLCRIITLEIRLLSKRKVPLQGYYTVFNFFFLTVRKNVYLFFLKRMAYD